MPFAAATNTSLEILKKELTVHKEMVAELRQQLIEREQEFQVSGYTLITYYISTFKFHFVIIFQELNSKAETKFNKLKAQAKTKIANLNKELASLRAEHGETPGNVSAMVSSEVDIRSVCV